jgi:hypothetical protein
MNKINYSCLTFVITSIIINNNTNMNDKQFEYEIFNEK